MLASVPSGAGQYRFVRVIPVLIFPGARSCVGFVLPAKRQVIPRSRGTDPEPAVPAWAHGTDGVGPALLSPDGAPVRWLLMDGYVYDIRDDQDHPPLVGNRVTSRDLARLPTLAGAREASTTVSARREARLHAGWLLGADVGGVYAHAQVSREAWSARRS